MQDITLPVAADMLDSAINSGHVDGVADVWVKDHAVHVAFYDAPDSRVLLSAFYVHRVIDLPASINTVDPRLQSLQLRFTDPDQVPALADLIRRAAPRFARH